MFDTERDGITTIVVIVIFIAILWFLFNNDSNEKFDNDMNTISENKNNVNNGETKNENKSENTTNNIANSVTDLLNYTGLTQETKSLENSENSKQQKQQMINAMKNVKGDNLLNIGNINDSDYMQKYYPLYKHQINCMERCGLNNTDYKCVQPADPIRMSLDAMNYANNKTCSTCTAQLNDRNFGYNSLPNDTIALDDDRLKMKENGINNVNKLVDFNNVTFQDSISGPTQIGRINVERTSVLGTCDLNKFGNTIANSFDGLIGISQYKQNEKLTQQLVGYFEGNSEGNIYANYNQ